jgi:P-type Ca2+ transporter type 2C
MKPRNRKAGLFTRDELLVSIVQGVIISAGILILYYWFMSERYSLEETRTIVFTTLVMSNIFLTFTNRSFTENFTKTIYYKNTLVLPVFIISILFLVIINYVTPVRSLFELTAISGGHFLLCLAVAFACVMWFEMYKTDLRNTK